VETRADCVSVHILEKKNALPGLGVLPAEYFLQPGRVGFAGLTRPAHQVGQGGMYLDVTDLNVGLG
jgi:hypothetical protein